MGNLVFRGADNRALTNSLLVAEKFGKEHGDVLKAIDAVFTKVPENQCKGYFSDTSIEIPQPNGGIRHSRVVVMNRDGFTLLVMGFTGKRAFQFKLAYIAAFNAMEKTIKKDYTRALSDMDQRIKVIEERRICFEGLPSPAEELPKMSQRDCIRSLVNKIARATSTNQSDIWHKVYNHLYYRYHISIRLFFSA